MMQAIRTITLALPYGLGTVNCYLLSAGKGHILIDTGPSHRRAILDQELARSGCLPAQPLLVVLTHGDFDHTGNVAHICAGHGAQSAMGADDAPMVERGDMFAGRKRPNWLVRSLAPLLFGFHQAERFRPDWLPQEGDALSAHGLDARVLSLPGHSRGSLGILTAEGDLFCGDLLDNTAQPALNSLMDDPAAGQASLARLSALPIRTVYPGHGQPFPMSKLATGGTSR